MSRKTVHVVYDKDGPRKFVEAMLGFSQSLECFAQVTEIELASTLDEQSSLIASADLVVVVLDQVGAAGGRQGILPLFPRIVNRVKQPGRLTLGVLLLSQNIGPIPSELRSPGKDYHLLGYPRSGLSGVVTKARSLLKTRAA